MDLTDLMMMINLHNIQNARIDEAERRIKKQLENAEENQNPQHHYYYTPSVKEETHDEISKPEAIFLIVFVIAVISLFYYYNCDTVHP